MHYPFNTISLILFMMTSCQSQSLTTHQWENRLLLVLAEDTSNTNFQKQIQHLTKNIEALTERKLLIYKVFPNEYIMGLENVESKSSRNLHEKYNSKLASFKVILIGLDGGIKLEQTEILSIEKLKAIIDVMPMRMNEMRNNE